jgi:hypothetical protein
LARQKTRTKLFSARSEMKKGFTMPTIKKIRSVLMSRSKTFLVNLIITMMAKKSKTEKIKILIKIEKGKIVRKVKRRRKAKSTKKGMVRKTARKAFKPKKGRKKSKLKKGSAAAKRKMAKVRAAKRRR